VRVRLLALLGASLLIMFVIIGLSMYFLLFRLEQGIWQDRQREAARYSEKITVAFLDNIQNSLNTIASVGHDRLDAQPEVMQSMLQENPALLEVIRLDDKGQVLASAHQDVPELANLLTITQSDWFTKARSGQHYLGDVQISSNDQPYAIVALPAAGGGVAAARLSMKALWDLMSDIQFGDTGTGYVIDRDGQIVAHSNPDIVLAHTQTKLPPASSASSGELYTNFAGVPVVGVQMPVQGTGWTLISEVSQAEALGTTRAAPWLIIGGLALLGAVTVFITTRSSIGSCSAPAGPASRRRAHGARRSRSSYQHYACRRDRLYSRRSFNQMADQLRDMVDTLETHVEMRTAQVAASADVGRAVTSILDPDLLLKQVVSLITDRLGYYYAAAFTLDPAGRYAVLREAAGPGDAAWLLKQAGHQLEISGNSMVAAAIREQGVRIALDVGAEAVRFANPLLPDTHSEAALPLMVGKQVIGALDVQSAQYAAFDEASAAMLQNVADQIAVALNNAAQYQRELTRAQQTTHLLEATVELTAHGQTTVLHNRIIELMAALLHVDTAGLWQPLEGDELVLTHAIGELRSLISQRVRSGEGIAGRVHATGLALRLDEARSWQDAATDLGDSPVRAVLAVPMIWQGQVIGVLMAAHSNPGQVFSADDGNTAQLFAGQAASALENTQLLDRLQGTLIELSAANRRLTDEAWQAHTRGREISYEYRRTSEGQATAPTLTLKVPIELRGQSIGQVVMEDDQPQRQLSAEEQDLVQEVVQRMALALESARLFEQTQAALGEARRLAQRERLINRITSQLRSAVTVEEVLRIAANEMRRSVGATYTAATLAPPASTGNGQGDA
jgi:GAF domain-containing protein